MSLKSTKKYSFGKQKLKNYLKANTKGRQQGCPGNLKHMLHIDLIRGRCKVLLDVAGRLHEGLGRLADAFQLHVPQDLFLLLIQGFTLEINNF